jgi:hypothetical protein
MVELQIQEVLVRTELQIQEVVVVAQMVCRVLLEVVTEGLE